MIPSLRTVRKEAPPKPRYRVGIPRLTEHPVELPSRISISPWRTLGTFVLGDVFGLLCVLVATTLLGHWVFPTYDVGAFPLGAIGIGGTILVFTIAGLYKARFTHPALEMRRISLLALFVGTGAGATIYVATGSGQATILLFIAGILGSVVLPVQRALVRILFAQTTWWGVPAVLVSSGESGRTLLTTLQQWPEIGVRPVALLTDTLSDAEGLIQGGHEKAPLLAQRFDIPYVILDMPALSHIQRVKLLASYSKFFDHVFVVNEPAGAPALWTTSRSGEGLLGYGVRNIALRPSARLTKRLADLIGASAALVLLGPLLAAIAIWIRKGSAGSVIYSQERMGRKGRIITILKFRTMYEDAEQKLAEILDSDPGRRREYEQFHKLEDDPRVTPLGKILRRYSLDELPQIVNVLRGDMSLVGPRAYMPSELGHMNGLSSAVLQCPPGMTGLWQVSGRNHLSFDQRVSLDVHYVQNWSPWLDLYLLIRTVPTVLTGKGAG